MVFGLEFFLFIIIILLKLYMYCVYMLCAILVCERESGRNDAFFFFWRNQTHRQTTNFKMKHVKFISMGLMLPIVFIYFCFVEWIS